MTFILSLQGQSSIWLCADRRLTYPNRVVDTGMKISEISGTDGRAFLGYAGLGASIAGTEPSAWMNDLLKDRGRLTIEQMLGVIANAMRAKLPRHLAGLMGEQSHVMIAVATVNGVVRLYQLSVATQPGATLPQLIFTRHEKPSGRPATFATTGSGAHYLMRNKGWHRELLRVLKAVEAGRVNPRAVADRLAGINQMIAELDPSVSKRCVVKWWTDRGEHQFYDGVKRVEADAPIPSVGNGMDVLDIARAAVPLAQAAFADLRAGGPGEIDHLEMQAAVNREHGRRKREL